VPQPSRAPEEREWLRPCADRNNRGMASNPFGYTPGDVLRALAARNAPTHLDDLAGDLGRNAYRSRSGSRT
jgi:hypothetical protein